MNLKGLIPAPIRALIGRSFSLSAQRFLRGDDADVAGKKRLWEPYAQSAWIRAAVGHVASPISGRPLKFYGGEQEYEDRRLAEWWRAPAVGPKVAGRQTRLPLEQVLFDLAAWNRLEGEFFIVLDDAWLITAGRSAAAGTALPPFLIANPQRMQEVVSGGELVGWRYSDAGGRMLSFLPEQVIHRRDFNPYHEWRGLGCLQAAKVSADSAFLTSAYIRDLARNNGDAGMNVIAKGALSDPQREQILADLRAKRAALARGEARDLLLGGDISVDRPKEQAASAELISSLGMSQQEVFVAFNVPPSMAAVKQAYSIGKESDKYQLITDTCQPVGQVIAAALGEVASRQTGLALEGELEWDDHPVMIEVRNSRLESALKLWGVGMPLKDANDYLGLGMKPFVGWEQGYLPFSVSPVDSQPADPVVDPALQETTPAPTEDGDVQRLRLLVLTRAKARQCVNVTPAAKTAPDLFAAFACECQGKAGVALKERDAKEVAQWRTLMAKRRGVVKSFEAGFGRALMAARQETLRNIERLLPKSAPAGGTVAKASVADLLFDLAKFAEGFTAVMRDRQRDALDQAGGQLFAEVGKDDPFKYPPEAVLDYLAARENKLSNTPTQIHEEIKAAIEEGLVKGETTDQLAARVRSTFNGINQTRARRIAMTETAAAYGAGREEAMQQAGVQYKRWLTSGGDNVRGAHAEANGQTVPVDQPFEVGGEQLMFPGDDAGSAENVINCHCVSIAVAQP